MGKRSIDARRWLKYLFPLLSPVLFTFLVHFSSLPFCQVFTIVLVVRVIIFLVLSKIWYFSRQLRGQFGHGDFSEFFLSDSLFSWIDNYIVKRKRSKRNNWFELCGSFDEVIMPGNCPKISRRRLWIKWAKECGIF